METKMVYLIVAVEMDVKADEQEVIQECDYSFNSPAIKSTEIQEIFNQKEQQTN